MLYSLQNCDRNNLFIYNKFMWKGVTAHSKYYFERLIKINPGGSVKVGLTLIDKIKR